MSDQPLHRKSRIRKRAAPTGTAFDFIRIEVPCPQCGKQTLQPLAELAVNTDATCGYCGNRIDLSSKEWRDEIAQLSHDYQQIKPV